MVVTVLDDEGAVGIVKIKVAGKLVVRRFAGEIRVAALLVLGEEADFRTLLPSTAAARTRGCPCAST